MKKFNGYLEIDVYNEIRINKLKIFRTRFSSIVHCSNTFIIRAYISARNLTIYKIIYNIDNFVHFCF